MKQRISIYRNTGLKILIILLFLAGSYHYLLSQTPTHYPTKGDPIEFDLVNILVYIGGPLLLLGLYLWRRNVWKKRRRRRNEEIRKQENKES